MQPVGRRGESADMPKKIEDLQATILRQSRDILLRDGYDRLTIRGVAATCGVAVGTVYNYFPSKDMLVASVMLGDWEQALRRMEAGAAGAESVLEGLRAVFDAIAAFAAVYAGAWAQYSARADAAPVTRARHQQLIGQLCAVIEPLTRRFNRLFHPSLPSFLAETLLSSSIGPDARFDELLPILERLLRD